MTRLRNSCPGKVQESEDLGESRKNDCRRTEPAELVMRSVQPVAEAVMKPADESQHLLFFVLEDFLKADAFPGDELDPQLWSSLPEEVLDRVLLLVPARSQARFRAVSKAWLHRLTCKPFRELTAALAFSRGQAICAVCHSGIEDHASEILSRRFKVHIVSLDFLPSRFRDATDIVCQHGLVVSRTATWVAGGPMHLKFFACVSNPTNLTSRILPELSSWFHREVSELCLEGSKGDCTFSAYVNGSRRSPFGALFHSSGDAWEQLHWEQVDKGIQPWIKHHSRSGFFKDPSYVTGFIKDARYAIHDNRKGTFHVTLYCLKSGDHVHRFPPWEQGGDQPALVKVAVRNEEYVALAFSTSKEYACEVWQVSTRDTTWVRVTAMPHDQLRCCDRFFSSMRDVEVVSNIAFIAVTGYDIPVHTWEALQEWRRLQNWAHTEHGYLVACDLVQGSWSRVCERWPFPSRRRLIQLNPALDLSRRGGYLRSDIAHRT